MSDALIAELLKAMLADKAEKGAIEDLQIRLQVALIQVDNANCTQQANLALENEVERLKKTEKAQASQIQLSEKLITMFRKQIQSLKLSRDSATQSSLAGGEPQGHKRPAPDPQGDPDEMVKSPREG
ncbi:hypothetical protein Ocin01_13458 [Orchesella cincta]|uniref:Uncharacterized protein n=1 Tax=Orchesella cincta TaxID=48709 RepID=A0A1D2MK03_ORCCI|nr:hypothetical protein Ocin01_13458 [Orchesella cincta]